MAVETCEVDYLSSEENDLDSDLLTLKKLSVYWHAKNAEIKSLPYTHYGLEPVISESTVLNNYNAKHKSDVDNLSRVLDESDIYLSL